MNCDKLMQQMSFVVTQVVVVELLLSASCLIIVCWMCVGIPGLRLNAYGNSVFGISPKSTIILMNIVSSRTYGLPSCSSIANGKNFGIPLAMFMSDRGR